MLQTKSSTSRAWAVLLPQDGAPPVYFLIKENEPNEYNFCSQWKIYQTPDGAITKILNWSASYFKVNDELLGINEERSLVSQDKITFGEGENNAFDYEFLLIKLEPRNELKRDRDEDHHIWQDFNDMEKQVKLEDDAHMERNLFMFSDNMSNKENQTSEFCLNGKECIEENAPKTTWKSGNKRGEKKPPKRRIFGQEISSQNIQQQSKINFSNGGVYEGELKERLMHGKGLLHFDNGDKYTGDFNAGKREGFGEMKYSNGNIYKGNWKDNKREGKGFLTLKNGLPFEGTWIDDVIQPKVTIHYDKGGRYDGTINQETLLREGKGVLKISNGDFYDGEFVKEHFEGQGIYTWKDGDVYDGEWKNGRRDGKGVMKYVNGNEFECHWKKDKREGKGILKIYNGNVYEEEDGKGTMKDAKKNRFECNWEKDKKEGKVRLKNRDILEGKWVNDVLQMPVKIFYFNKDKYKGEVNKNSFKRHGKGVLTSHNGDIYDGDWKNDKKEGIGIWKSGNGIKYEGQWKNDEKFEGRKITCPQGNR